MHAHSNKHVSSIIVSPRCVRIVAVKVTKNCRSRSRRAHLSSTDAALDNKPIFEGDLTRKHNRLRCIHAQRIPHGGQNALDLLWGIDVAVSSQFAVHELIAHEHFKRAARRRCRRAHALCLWVLGRDCSACDVKNASSVSRAREAIPRVGALSVDGYARQTLRARLPRLNRASARFRTFRWR